MSDETDNVFDIDVERAIRQSKRELRDYAIATGQSEVEVRRLFRRSYRLSRAQHISPEFVWSDHWSELGSDLKPVS